MLTPDQVDDFVTLTLPLFKKRKWTDISLEFQHYVSARFINEKTVEEQGGPFIDFKVKTQNLGTAINSGLYHPDTTKVDDTMITAQIPWRFQTANFSYDIYEDGFQSDNETIIKLLQVREHMAYCDLAELNEQNLWSAPTSTTDKRPMGIPFWLQKDPSTDPDGDFNGGNPSGFAAGRAGIDSDTYPNWRNWTFGYTKVTTDDLIKKVKKALAFTEFVPPVPHPEVSFGSVMYELYTTYRVQEACERLAETRNDNLGRDLARYLNQTVIGGAPLRWVPYLNKNDTSDPIYGINWHSFRPFVKKGCNMKRMPPKQAPNQHTVRNVFIDHWMNYACTNLRRCFVGSIA